MIERLTIHRFRGIREGRLERIGKINVLIGPNNSGKSAILEMLYLATTCGRSCVLLPENLVKTSGDEGFPEAFVPLAHDFLGYTPWPRIWKRHGQAPVWTANPGNLTPERSLIYRLGLADDHPLQSFRLVPPPSEEIEYGGFEPNDAHEIASFALKDNGKLPPVLLPTFLRAQTAYDLPALLTYAWYPSLVHGQRPSDTSPGFESLSVWSMEGRAHHPGNVLFFDFHTAHDHFTPTFHTMAWKTVPDWYEKIAAALVQVYPELGSCRVEIAAVDARTAPSMMTGYIRLPGSTPLAVDNFGDGTRHVFKVLSGLIALRAFATDRQTGLFLWEDPELFMHPAALQALLRQVVAIVADAPIQLFISTHSNEVIAELVRLAMQDSELAGMLCAFRVGNKDGRLISSRYQTDNLRSWLGSGKDPRFWGVADTALRYRLEEDDE